MFDRLATKAAHAAGSSAAFVVFLVVVVAWLAGGAPLGWSDTWHLLINTPTTIVTTGLVILVQRTQNRDEKAVHAKLDALIAASDAPDRYASIETMATDDLNELHRQLMAEIESRAK